MSPYLAFLAEFSPVLRLREASVEMKNWGDFRKRKKGREELMLLMKLHYWMLQLVRQEQLASVHAHITVVQERCAFGTSPLRPGNTPPTAMCSLNCR